MLYTHDNHLSHNCDTINLCKYSQIRPDSVFSDRDGLLASEFGSSTRGERHNSYYADHTI